MNKIELKNYPLSAKVVKEWFMKEMIESFKDETVPIEFKDFMLEQGIEDNKVETLINLNPKSLFDLFDENNIIIQIQYNVILNSFNYEIIGEVIDYNNIFIKRKEAELNSIIKAFNVLEKKLTQLEFPNLKEE